MGTLQRAAWDGHPMSLGHAFEMRKAKGHRQLHTVCSLSSHLFGFELRLEVNGLLSRSQVCRSTDEVLDTSAQWRVAMLAAAGWQA